MERLVTSDDPEALRQWQFLVRWLDSFGRRTDELLATVEANRAVPEGNPGGTPYMEADSGSVDPVELTGGPL